MAGRLGDNHARSLRNLGTPPFGGPCGWLAHGLMKFDIGQDLSGVFLLGRLWPACLRHGWAVAAGHLKVAPPTCGCRSGLRAPAYAVGAYRFWGSGMPDPYAMLAPRLSAGPAGGWRMG